MLDKELFSKLFIVPANLADYPIIQNMARFYVYDRTYYMGWACSENGMFECIDFKHYFIDPASRAFLVKFESELAGFILLDKISLIEAVDWNMGEFFILAKFQKYGVGSWVAQEIFKQFLGKWSVAVMPENLRAVNFWRKNIRIVSNNNFTETFHSAEELQTLENPDPYSMNIFTFNI